MFSTALHNYVKHFQARVLQDALNEATAAYWLRRAAEYEAAARPRPGGWVGFNSTSEERAARRQRMQETAAACRARAQVSLIDGGIEEDVWNALAEASQQDDQQPYYPPAA
jgi:hypothetical protein